MSVFGVKDLRCVFRRCTARNIVHNTWLFHHIMQKTRASCKVFVLLQNLRGPFFLDSCWDWSLSCIILLLKNGFHSPYHKLTSWGCVECQNRRRRRRIILNLIPFCHLDKSATLPLSLALRHSLSLLNTIILLKTKPPKTVVLNWVGAPD